jgi:hydroxymethylbilane synthase
MRIGTRGSRLALWQAHTVARLLQQTGGPACEIVIIRTSGDERPGPPDPSPAATGAPPSTASPTNVKRLFVKEIEEALLDGRVDLAVHSAKDLPADLPDGLFIAAALEREDPRDAILLPASSPAQGYDAVRAALAARPAIGTSSVRRIAQLRAVFHEATFREMRGNVDTRLRKLDAGDCDAIILAAAGVKRLGFEKRLSALLPVDVCVPAPGQGIVAIEMASDAPVEMRQTVARISDADADATLLAERAVVKALGGGCQMPLGALAHVDGQDLLIEGVVASLDGRAVVRASARGHRGNAAATGDKLAAQLLAKGAGELLK